MNNNPLMKYLVLFSIHAVTSSSIALKEAQGGNSAAARGQDSSGLDSSIPACAQPCVRNFILRRFKPLTCSGPDDFECLCSRYLQSGSAIEEIVSECYKAGCTDERDSKRKPDFDVCKRYEPAAAAPIKGPPSRQQKTRTTHLAPIVTRRPRGKSRTMSDELPSEISAPDTATVEDGDDIFTATNTALETPTPSPTSQALSDADSTTASTSHARTSTPAPRVKPLTPGQIGGITVAGVATAVIVFFILGSIFACLKRRRQDSRSSSRSSGEPKPRFGGPEKDFDGGALQSTASGRDMPRLSAAYPKIVDPDKIGMAISSPSQADPNGNQHRRSSTAMLIPKAPSSNLKLAPEKPNVDKETLRPDSDVTIMSDLSDLEEFPSPPQQKKPAPPSGRPSLHITPATPTRLTTNTQPHAYAPPRPPPAQLQPPPPTTTRQKQKPPLIPLRLTPKKNRESTQSTNTIINEEPQTAALAAQFPGQANVPADTASGGRDRGYIPSYYMQSPRTHQACHQGTAAPPVPFSSTATATARTLPASSNCIAPPPRAAVPTTAGSSPNKAARSNTMTSTTSDTSFETTFSSDDPTPPKEENKTLTTVIESPNPGPGQQKISRPPLQPISSNSPPGHQRSDSSVSTTSTIAEKRKGSDAASTLQRGLWVTESRGKTTAPIGNGGPVALAPAPVAWSTTVPLSNSQPQTPNSAGWPTRSSSRGSSANPRLNSRGSRLGRQMTQDSSSSVTSPTRTCRADVEEGKQEMVMKSSVSPWEPRLTPRRGGGGDLIIDVS